MNNLKISTRLLLLIGSAPRLGNVDVDPGPVPVDDDLLKPDVLGHLLCLDKSGVIPPSHTIPCHITG